MSASTIRELASRAALVPWSTARRATRLDLVTLPTTAVAAPSL